MPSSLNKGLWNNHRNEQADDAPTVIYYDTPNDSKNW